MAVLVFADSNNGRIVKSSFEAVSYGSKIAADLGTAAIVVTYGNVSNEELESLGN